MNSTFDPAMRLLLRHEGGWTNNSRDPGGMTNLGVTKRAWEKFLGHPVTEADMRALTPAKVTPFYKAEYWDKVKADQLPAGVDYCLFDTCVNSGPSRATMLLQDALGISIDGRLGPATLSAVKLHSASFLLSAYTTARLSYLRDLPTWEDFGKGWSRRIAEVEQEAKAFAGITVGEVGV